MKSHSEKCENVKFFSGELDVWVCAPFFCLLHYAKMSKKKKYRVGVNQWNYDGDYRGITLNGSRIATTTAPHKNAGHNEEK